MGGRGSLSSKKHVMYDRASIKAYMNSKGVAVHGLNAVTKKGLSLVVEALETLDTLQTKHGKRIDNIIIGTSGLSDFSFSEAYQHKNRKGEVLKVFPNTLIIPRGTVEVGKKHLNKEVKYANKSNFVVAKNVKEMIYHEFGHALHEALKKANKSSYDDLERRFGKIMKDPKARVELSGYAKTKKYKKRSQSTEYVAESVVHILRGTTTRKGKDMVDLVRNYLYDIPGANIRLGDSKRVTKPRSRKPRGTSTRNTSSRSRKTR